MRKIAEKRKAPSRLRYEEGHPTVSCRVSQDTCVRLRKAKETEEKSFADILKIGLGILETKQKKESELIRIGYKKGYADAESVFKITYPCNICGKTITVTGHDDNKVIRQYLWERGWGHPECHTWRA